MNKPFVLLNAAMTVDGKIAPEKGNMNISNQKDLERVHKIRKESDAIMVGINTILTDDPRLTVHKINANKKDNPVRIIIDSRARTPCDSRCLDSNAHTIIAVSKKAPINNIKKLNDKCEIIVSGEDKVDLVNLMNILYNKGIKTVLLEGGATLNYSMFNYELIDKVSICIGPMILGGKHSNTFVDGDGFNINNCISLKLDNFYTLNEDIVLEYSVKY